MSVVESSLVKYTKNVITVRRGDLFRSLFTILKKLREKKSILPLVCYRTSNGIFYTENNQYLWVLSRILKVVDVQVKVKKRGTHPNQNEMFSSVRVLNSFGEPKFQCRIPRNSKLKFTTPEEYVNYLIEYVNENEKSDGRRNNGIIIIFYVVVTLLFVLVSYVYSI